MLGTQGMFVVTVPCSSRSDELTLVKLPLLFNTTSVSSSPVADTAAEVEIGKYFRGAWATFAKEPIDGLTGYGWPQYSPNTSSLIRIAFNNQTGPHLAIGSMYDIDCPGLGPAAPNGSSSPNSTQTGKPGPSATAANGGTGVRVNTSLIGVLVWLAVSFIA